MAEQNAGVSDNHIQRTGTGAISRAEFPKKEQIRCLLCGGKDCSKCGLDAYKALPTPAIALLHSHWINDSIVAMQRPNNTSLDNGALEDMVNKKITAVFNLTEPGEHPYCGCGNLSHSGFPYSPEKLMHAGVKHFNFCWQDMTVPPIPKMMDIVTIAINELTTGGKIAVHCHAGFGRTGLTIACILIAKDLLEAHQVIQFVRNRRPGSIQTTAQQQFVQNFERAWVLRMQLFPVLELDFPNGAKKGQKVHTMHVKSIKTSVQDQQYFLTHAELVGYKFKYMHKLTHYTLTALKRLSHENFITACLAITGLTRLNIKKNLELENDDHRPISPIFSPGNIMQQKSGRKLVKKKSSFMVATNSLSESAEENIMNEVKIELNSNRWARLFSLAEILNIDLNSEADPIKRTMKSQMPPSFSTMKKELSSDHVSHKEELLMLSASQSPKSSTTLNPPPSAIPQLPTVIEADTKIEAIDAHKGDNVEELGTSSKKLNYAESLSYDSEATKPPFETIGIPIPTVINTNMSNRSDEERDKNSNASTPVHSPDRLPPVNGSRSNSGKFPAGPIRQLSFGSKQFSISSSGSNASGPGHMSRANSERANRTTTLPAISMSKIRSNSLRQISEAEFLKSKKMALNLLAQLLLDWLETRQRPIFEDKVVEKLGNIFLEHGQRNFHTTRASSPPPLLEEQLNVQRPKSRQDGKNSREHSFSNNRSLSTGHQQNSRENSVQGNSVHLDPFNTSVKTDPSSELIAEVSNALHEHLDKYSLELLKGIVSTYKELCCIGIEIANASEQQSASARKGTSSSSIAANTSTSNSGGGSAGKIDSPYSLGTEEYEALEALVGLRLAIACMHARKNYQGLIRQRALVIDLVKVFLLKSTASDVVIINNITFSEESFEHVKNTIGATLITQLDVVFRTLRLLAEEDERQPLEISHPTVSWQLDTVSNFSPKAAGHL